MICLMFKAIGVLLGLALRIILIPFRLLLLPFGVFRPRGEAGKVDDLLLGSYIFEGTFDGFD